MSGKYYRLGEDGRTPEPCDMIEWAQTCEGNGHARVGLTEIGEAVKVSTVFLGLNHNWGGGPPILFETMIFGGPHDQEQWRYSTWAEAEEGHARAVALAESVAAPEPHP